MPSHNWFHGTISGPIKNFYPLTHFGSDFAATWACTMKYKQHKNAGNAPPPLQPTIIEATITVAPSNTLTISEWYSTNPYALAKTIHTTENLSVKFRSAAEAICDGLYKIDDRKRWAEFGIPKLIALLKANNIQAIYYRNEVEAVNSGVDLSVLVVDPSIISDPTARPIPTQTLDSFYFNHIA